jgi:FlaA1/EpsC-like NDP-sugar epimerase
MEMNVEEAVTNNILGTQVLVDLSIETPVERMVMISSDKAVCPSSIMGATKRVAELIVVDSARRSGKSFSVVRFGNVLGSRGSIVPLFKRQIAGGGPITITHPDMKRFFMTIPEAVHLVLQASAMGVGAETFVLRMGEQIRIVELAEDLIRLSGLEPEKDIEIVFTGAKPGEKLSEQLWESDATVKETAHPDIIQVEEDNLCSPEELSKAVDTLIADARQGKTKEIEVLLRKMIPGAVIRPPSATDVGALV